MPTLALWVKYQWDTPNNVLKHSILIPENIHQREMFATQVWKMDMSEENASPVQAFSIIINFDSLPFFKECGASASGDFQEISLETLRYGGAEFSCLLCISWQYVGHLQFVFRLHWLKNSMPKLIYIYVSKYKQPLIFVFFMLKLRFCIFSTMISRNLKWFTC